VDADILERTRETINKYVLKALDDGFSRLDRILKASTIEFDSSISSKLSNNLHIDYEPKSDRERTKFSKLLNDEIKIWLKGPEHNERLHHLLSLPLDQKREAVREFGNFEANIVLARVTVKRHDTANAIAIALSVDKLIPCILHMKMRVVEKIFHSMVHSAMDRYGESRLDKPQLKVVSTNIEM
jgi:hypothetical protein